MRPLTNKRRNGLAGFCRAYPFVGIFVFTAAIILCAYYTHFPFHPLADTEADYLDSVAVFRVQVLEPPLQRKKNIKLEVKLLDIYLHESARQLNQNAVLFIKRDSLKQQHVEMGDILLVKTRIERPTSLFYGDYDYGKYLLQNKKVGVGFVQPSYWKRIGNAPLRTIRAYAIGLRQRLIQRYIDAGLTDRSLAFISAITLGEKDSLDSNLREAFAVAGVAHVLAISGLHTGIIYLVITSLLTCFGFYRPLYEQRFRRVLLSVAIICIMWGYAFVTGMSPSVMRASLMLTIIQVGWMCGRHSISYNSLAATACICLWANPLSLFNVSFQLSFTAVLGILLFAKYLSYLFNMKGNWLLRWPRIIITTSIAATIGTLPVTLYYFGQISHYFLLTNLVILPITYILVILGVAVLLLSHTSVGVLLGSVLQFIGDWTCSFVQWVEHLPFATLPLPVTPWMTVCLVAAITCLYMSIRRKHLAWIGAMAALMGIFCYLHIDDVRVRVHEQHIAVQGRTIYYRHGYTTDKYPFGRYAFFAYKGKTYVYAPNISPRKRALLDAFCEEKQIMSWQSSIAH